MSSTPKSKCRRKVGSTKRRPVRRTWLWRARRWLPSPAEIAKAAVLRAGFALGVKLFTWLWLAHWLPLVTWLLRGWPH